MKHRRQHYLLIAAAALAVGVAPAWSPMANADETAAADDTTTSSEVTDPAAPAGPAEPTDPTEPADPVDPVDEPADEVTDPAAGDDATEPAAEPATEPNGPDPVADGDGVVVTEEEGEDGGHDDGGHEGGGHGEGGTIPDGVTVTVDGRDVSATDPEGSLPKIAGCSFDITASGLTTDPADTVGVKVIAWPPSVTEENRVTLVDVTETSSEGAWAGSFPLDEAVQQFERKGNGYHMRLELFINGDQAVMKMYWLGCGEPQTGNPRRMLFDVQWYDSDGVLVTEALNDVLPAGWREDFALTASGERGTVACSYLPGDDLLNCLYDNPGHGDDPGLVLPGKPGMEYTVDVAGVPEGWVVDAETIGTFLADDTCPKGGGGHHDGEDGDHEDASVRVEGDEGEEGGHEPCVHNVIVNQLTVEPPPDDEGGGDVDPPADDDNGNTPNGGGNANPPAGNAAGLPLTGATSLPLVPVGLMLLLVGTALVVSTRRPMVVVDA